MLEKIIQQSIRHRWIVLIIVVALSALGIYNFQRLPIDAVPDITNVQVQINTEAAGYSPLEAEQRITYPIETAISPAGGTGLYPLDLALWPEPGYGRLQGRHRYLFRTPTRHERVQSAKSQLPEGAEPTLGPISTGLGEIFMYTVEAKPGAVKADGTAWNSEDLRTLQDWVVKPQLRNTPGVTEVTPSRF